jgi:prephenate dehydratase
LSQEQKLNNLRSLFKSQKSATASSEADLLRSVAIQGERGSNSHMAAFALLGPVDVLPCVLSVDVLAALVENRVDAAVLPIENSLHGSVAEHYDLLLTNPVRIDAESLLRVRHNLIAAPGVELADIRTVLSHPVALSQCRDFLAGFTQARAIPFYDTAGSVKHLMAWDLRDTAGIAPVLAAEEYQANVLVAGIEDHAQNYTRFHLVRRSSDAVPKSVLEADKLSAAFAVDHKPGTLVNALQRLAEVGVNLTKIESRPVPGQPWEYVFFVEFRYEGAQMAEAGLSALRSASRMVKELGRYRAAAAGPTDIAEDAG